MATANLAKLMQLICIITTLSFLLGCGGKSRSNRPVDSTSVIPHARGEKARARTVFVHEDSQYDDRGAGHYLYPISLQNRDGIFDLRRFEVRNLDRVIEFRLDFLRPIDTEDLISLDRAVDPQSITGLRTRKGWAFQLVDIYIDTDRTPGSGLTFALPGRNVEFNYEEAWDHAIVLTPGPNSDVNNYLLERSEYRELHNNRKRIHVPNDVHARHYSLVARVPKQQIGDPQPDWGYQVFVMGYDSSNTSRNGMFNMRVKTFPTDNAFGGGTDYQGNPNIIDILSPDKRSQYHVLSQYRSNPYQKDNLLSIVPMIYSKGKQKTPIFREKSIHNAAGANSGLIDSRYTSPVKVRR